MPSWKQTSPVRTDGALWALSIALIAGYYLLLLSNGSFHLIAPETLDRVFDSSLQHLLRGNAEVDPAAIQHEAFVRGGRTYTYFGIVPALLRLPALLFAADPAVMHLARLSCLVAATGITAVTCATIVLAHRSLPPALRSRTLLAAVLAGVVLGGPVVTTIFAAYVYNEPVLWAGLFVAVFNAVIIRSVLRGLVLSPRALCLLAALAVLAINTRPTSGIDLLVGWGLVTLVYAEPWLRGIAALRWPALILPGSIVAAGLGVVGLVNTLRWGNPLTFADFSLAPIMQPPSTRLANIEQYGVFNARRIPLSGVYYLTGLPFIMKYMGVMRDTLDRFYDLIEGPPSSPFLTGPLWVVLAIAGVREAVRGGSVVIGVLVGHVVCLVLLLMAMALTLRYRVDLAGLTGLLAVFGYLVASRWLAGAGARVRRAGLVAAVLLSGVGVAGSHYVLVMAKVSSPFVPIGARCALQPLVPFVRVDKAGLLPPGCTGNP